jgi:hypothetical protein
VPEMHFINVHFLRSWKNFTNQAMNEIYVSKQSVIQALSNNITHGSKKFYRYSFMTLQKKAARTFCST